MKSNYNFLLSIALACLSLTRGESQGTSIQVECKPCKYQKVTLRIQDLFSEYTLVRAESQLTDAGMGTLKVELADSVLALIQFGDSPQPKQDSVVRVYLMPDQNLKLTLHEAGVSFEGELSAVNQYLADSRQIAKVVFDRASSLSGKIRELPAGEKEKLLYSFGDEFKPLHLQIREDNRVPQKLKELIIADNDFLVRWRESYLRGVDWETVKTRSSYEASDFLATLPINPAYIQANMDWYRRVIDYEMMTSLHGPIFMALQKEGKEKNLDTLAILSEKAIYRNPRLAPIREFLIARHITRYLEDFGLTTGISQVFENFKHEFPNTPFSLRLEAIIDQYLDLGEGKVAKDFTATDASGKEMKLSDFKGKVVYIDTWATWCKPCIAEFPYSKNMVDHYKDNRDVVFLYVSLDDNVSKWKSFLKSDQVPSGIHVIHKASDPTLSMYTLYRMSGIPHYILIDKAGKIKVNRAPRPSDSAIYSFIDSLLDK